MTCGHGEHVWTYDRTRPGKWPYAGQPCKCGEKTYPPNRPLLIDWRDILGRGDKEQA